MKGELMSKKQKKLVALSAALAISFGIIPTANAMHIMEGYLPPIFCVVWGVVVSHFWQPDFSQSRTP